MYLNVRIAVEALEPIQLFFRGFPQKSRVLPPPEQRISVSPKGQRRHCSLLFFTFALLWEIKREAFINVFSIRFIFCCVALLATRRHWSINTADTSFWHHSLLFLLKKEKKVSNILPRNADSWKRGQLHRGYAHFPSSPIMFPTQIKPLLTEIGK